MFDQRITETFVELADTLVFGFDGIDFLHTLTERCVQLLGVDAAGILLVDQRDTLNLVAASTDQARLLELFQLQNEEGPCLDCYHSGHSVACADLGALPQRWPRFATAAREQGFTAVQAVPMRLREQIIGALPVPQHAHRHPRRNHRDGAVLCQRGHHQHSADPRPPTQRDSHRATTDRAQQSHPDRTGQRHPRRTPTHHRRRGIHADAHLRPQPQPTPLTDSESGHHPRPRHRRPDDLADPTAVTTHWVRAWSGDQVVTRHGQSGVGARRL